MKKYGSYKDSGVKWLGEIPEHWDVRKIKNLFNEKDSLFIDGDWIESKDIFGEDVIYYTTGNIQELKFIEKDKSYITEETFDKLNCTEVLSGDILISRLNLPLGRCCIAPKFEKKSVVSVDVVVFRPDKIFNRAYLLYLMNSPQYFRHTEDEARGAIMKRISRSILGNIKIPIPPPEEQQAIANFLDDKTTKIDQAIAIKEKEIELLKERRQILIQELVTGKKIWDGNQWTKPIKTKNSGVDWIGEIPEDWEELPNKYIFTIKKKLVGKNSSEYDLLSLTLQGVKPRDMENPEGKFPAEFDSYQEVSVGDFVFCLFDVEETPRTVGLSNFDGMITGAYTVMDSKKDINPKFLYYFYLFVDDKKRLRNLYRGLRNTIPKDSFMTFKTIIPSQIAQNSIVSQIENFEQKLQKAISLKQQEIEKLKEYKTVLIDSVVTGKVRVS